MTIVNKIVIGASLLTTVDAKLEQQIKSKI